MASSEHPSRALYQSLQTAYEHFNRELFEGRLPEVIFTVQRQKDVLGYFAPERWVSPNGERCHEIAINPSHMGQSRVIEVLQTLVHEMVHCWQYSFGKPGRRCYHNREWAYKMMNIGLQPSTTGEPGGEITGQHMSDYAIDDGRFMRACCSLVDNHAFRIPWIYRLSLPKNVVIEPTPQMDSEQTSIDLANPSSASTPDLETLTTSTSANASPEVFLHSSYEDVFPEGTFVAPVAPAKSKVKYQCPDCFVGVWGKPGIHLICGDCESKFNEV